MTAEYLHEEIGSRLRRLRRARGFTVAEFAKLHGWNPTQLTNWETGHRRITIDAAAQLRERYGVTLDWIYLGSEAALPQNVARDLASSPRDK